MKWPEFHGNAELSCRTRPGGPWCCNVRMLQRHEQCQWEITYTIMVCFYQNLIDIWSSLLAEFGAVKHIDAVFSHYNKSPCSYLFIAMGLGNFLRQHWNNWNRTKIANSVSLHPILCCFFSCWDALEIPMSPCFGVSDGNHRLAW